MGGHATPECRKKHPASAEKARRKGRLIRKRIGLAVDLALFAGFGADDLGDAIGLAGMRLMEVPHL